MRHVKRINLNEQSDPGVISQAETISEPKDLFFNRSLWEGLIKKDIDSLLEWVNYDEHGKLTSDQLRSVYELLSVAKEKARLTVLKNLR
jgi:hypothetical protein